MNKSRSQILFSGWILLTVAASAERIILQNDEVQLALELNGGAITEFQHKADALNPLSWDSSPNAESSSNIPRRRGHFICLDRWGPPTKSEASKGMPNHGEASNTEWRVISHPKNAGETIAAEMGTRLRLAGLSISRKIRLSKKSPVFGITEEIHNDRDIGRIYNIVQHPTIAPPFLSSDTIVDCNGTRGFAQNPNLDDPESKEAPWPFGLKPDGTISDIRRMGNDGSPGVVSYVIEEEIGWITAFDPQSGVLIGYIWQASDYPWINLWRQSNAGEPGARGLEFGTTGLHRPFPTLVEKGEIFNRSLYRYIDVSETQSFGYLCFIIKTEGPFTGVKNVRYQAGTITLFGEGSSQKPIVIEAKDLTSD